MTKQEKSTYEETKRKRQFQEKLEATITELKEKNKKLEKENKNIKQELIEITNTPILPENSTLQEYQEYKRKLLSIDCNKSICDGFISSITGEELKFGFDNLDQANFNQQLSLINADKQFNANAITEIEWAYKNWDTGVSTPVTLTVEQFIQLIQQAGQHKVNCIAKYRQLCSQLYQTVDIEGVMQIEWSKEI